MTMHLEQKTETLLTAYQNELAGRAALHHADLSAVSTQYNVLQPCACTRPKKAVETVVAARYALKRWE